MKKNRCPHCEADLRGEKIPDKYKKYFGRSKYFERQIGLYDEELDRVVEWQCPDCHKRWRA